MNKFDLAFSIISFMRENRLSKISDLGFKSPLVLSSIDNTEHIIEHYYEYDVTIFVYENSKRIKKYQEYYADLSIEILEQIYEQIQKYSKELKNEDLEHA